MAKHDRETKLMTVLTTFKGHPDLLVMLVSKKPLG